MQSTDQCSSAEIIRQDVPPNVRKKPTSQKQREDYKSFYLKKSTWDAIRISRGWGERGAISRFADELRITRQYAADLVRCNCGCSSNVIRRIVDLLGIKEGCWCHLFDKTNLREVDNNHPIFNQMKYNGEVPYERFSPSADARAKDYKVEKSAI
jgi:plasmid maintenance system antidote protein VapI